MKSEEKIDVVHVTTVHPWYDNRIYKKIILSLKDQGVNVGYIAPRSRVDENPEVPVLWLDGGSGLWMRVKKAFAALRLCMRSGARVVHFHDPEFIPFAILLRFAGKAVVYDVHEDNALGFRQKEYLRPWQRSLFAYLIEKIETLVSSCFCIVLAEKAYAYRFPKGVFVLNYPTITREPVSAACKNIDSDGFTIKLLYTGTVSIDRGALLHIDLMKNLPGSVLYVVGRCSDSLKKQLVDYAGLESHRLILHVSEEPLPFSLIEETYSKGGWDLGLAVFPETRHYREKELTKLFEYMKFGIPSVCSCFPVWQELVEKNDVGICVSPNNIVEAAIQVEEFLKDPQRYQRASECGMAVVREKYSWASQVQNLLALYSQNGVARVPEGEGTS